MIDRQQIYELLKDKTGPWEVYPNPMRGDGVFLAQKRPIKPYEGVTTLAGEPMFPAVPQGSYAYPHQLSPEVARNLRDQLNGRDCENDDSGPAGL